MDEVKENFFENKSKETANGVTRLMSLGYGPEILRKNGWKEREIFSGIGFEKESGGVRNEILAGSDNLLLRRIKGDQVLEIMESFTKTGSLEEVSVSIREEPKSDKWNRREVFLKFFSGGLDRENSGYRKGFEVSLQKMWLEGVKEKMEEVVKNWSEKVGDKQLGSELERIFSGGNISSEDLLRNNLENIEKGGARFGRFSDFAKGK